MNKGVITLSGLALLTILATSGIKKSEYSTGITGQSTAGCTCHSGKKGTVTLTGIGTTVVKGKAYPITVTYNQGATASQWGIDIKALTGTLTSSNSKISISSNEGYHNTPLGTSGTTYTYTGLTWTAPTTVTTAAAKVLTFATVGGSGGGNGYYALGTTSTQVVAVSPVEFETVNASWIGDNKVNLIWKTATENNTNYFEIERSFNNEVFTAIAKVTAAGMSSSLKTYSFEDKVLGSNVAYYRIKEVDDDGIATYSDINSVNVKPVKNFVKSVYPNPIVTGQPVNVDYVATMNGRVNIDLYNSLGKKMNSLTVDAVTGENNIKFNLGRFVSPGIYYVIVNDGIERIAQVPVSVQ